ncbi:mannose-6-phosphate isomerase, class I [Vibrio ulleungensis]|uniref:mannose-6-phosphate isomerase n=1 Tax=Vibrio ulleungensis TaxID=2807619 RepID=A0ABS2HG42_9VIBR|nr:mannose-6-phosphate isomerase, class I [Vibrio ulleungensis]MBM7036515.1 mannose-6-phosphate isomerase, class I [Vibrio ulleungensis]
MTLYKLNNVIQNYAWGSKSSMHDLFGYSNDDNQPQAELWMGAHPNGCSRLAGTDTLLSDLINQQPEQQLGEKTAKKFGELPYLFKVLAAATPLSIQVHPNKARSEEGFARENQQGIELSAGHRNYKDPNHKPELVYALTEYHAMNGFRPLQHIVKLFEEIEITALAEVAREFSANPNGDSLKRLFNALLSLDGDEKQSALNDLYGYYTATNLSPLAAQAIAYSKEFKQHYNDDVGLFAPLMLNLVVLQPGEAMFLYAETPHAYLRGTGLEIMANSDNVLRAGLTPKHIDVAELVDNTLFQPIDPQSIKMLPSTNNGVSCYPIPVEDFGFDVVEVTQAQSHVVQSAEILFCLDGEVCIQSDDQSITLTKGESLFASFDSQDYQYSGAGKMARAYN